MRVHGSSVLAQKSNTSPKSGSNESSNEEAVSSDTLADISGTDTSGHKEIPLVWVSRQGTVSKMHKCRFCPHVNVRKSNIQEHEKMHSTRKPKILADGTEAPPLQQHYCPDCNYICNNAGVLSSHAKVHHGMFGTVCALYDSSRSDEDQIEEVMAMLSSTKFSPKQVVISTDNETIETTPDISVLLNQSNSRDSVSEEESCQPNHASSPSPEQHTIEHANPSTTGIPSQAGLEDKVLHFCASCPARFLYENELFIHSKFHSLQLSHKCSSCSYTARQEQHMLAHYKVHSDEYQERTRALLIIYGQSSKHPRIKTAVVLDSPGMAGYIWVVVNDASQYVPTPFSLNFNINNTFINDIGKHEFKMKKPPARIITKQFSCTKCPAQFFKSVALQYHLTLHGGNGIHKCRSCDYAVKTYGNLIKHEQVHEALAPRVKCKLLKPVKKEEIKPANAFAKPEYHLKNIDPEFGFLMLGNPNFNYPTYIKNGKVKTKRYKCHKCPSAFEKREQYKVHLSLHGAQQKYRCEKCDYSVKYYANYIQHIRKHEKSESYNDLVKTENNACDTEIKPNLIMTNVPVGSTAGLINNLSQFQEQFHLCKFCPYASSKPEALKNHIKRHHASLTLNQPEISIELLPIKKEPPEVNGTKNEPNDLLWEESVNEAIDEEELNGDEVDFNNEEDDYDEELEKKFVMSSMMNGQAKHLEEYEEDEEDVEQDARYETNYVEQEHRYGKIDKDGFLEVDEVVEQDEDDEEDVAMTIDEHVDNVDVTMEETNLSEIENSDTDNDTNDIE